uniref:polysaccharide biosynthesis protein n=1 Tax=Frankia nepalensis TaxID=1836974 RepID=UPI003898E991
MSRLELRQRVGLQITLDSLALVVGLAAAQAGRFDFSVGALHDVGFWVVVLLAVCVLHFVGTALHLYLGRYRFGGFDEVLGLLLSVSLTVVGLEVALLAFGHPRPLPLSVPPLGGTVTLTVMFGARYLYRLAEEQLARPSAETGTDGADPAAGSGALDAAEAEAAALLGRRPIGVDAGAIAGYVTGRRVLVTGAGGAVGSALCRALRAYHPAELVMLDRDESALRALALALRGRADLPGDGLASEGLAGDDAGPDETVVLCDIRDVDMVAALFARYRPEVVFHTAALTHLPLLERFPGESVKTNVWGTLSVLEAAATHGVARLLNLSTLSATDAVGVLGYSKRITERLTAHVAREHGVAYVSARFGEVLGAGASALTVLARQLAAGGPLTVPDQDAVRHFLAVDDAVTLLLQAGAVGSGGDVLVLDMGKPIRLADIARRLAARADPAVGVVYAGLGAGEKLYEAPFGIGETDDRPHHPLISEVPVPPLDPGLAVELDPWADDEKIRAALRELGRGDDLTAITAGLTRIPRQATGPGSASPHRRHQAD